MNNTSPQVTQRLMGKIATLERRADHLQRQLNDWQSSSGARAFADAELSALESAMVCMRLQYIETERLEHPLQSLRDLIACLDKREQTHDEELTQLLERASVAVVEYDSGKTEQEGKSDERNKGLRTTG